VKTLSIILRSLIYVPAFILFFRWIALSVRPYDQIIGVILSSWTILIGIVFMIIGGFIGLICTIVFIRYGQGTPAIFDPPTKFIAVGPYKYVRNPMYIGGFILLIGFGLYHYSISILFLSLILIILFHLFIIFIEEQGLIRRFGQSYIEYKHSVNRWLPTWK
jgi:protein-S-isoprenylcysteine O-methyltransferase Ste14